MRRILFAALALAAMTGTAFAHAHLAAATPTPGGTVATAPAEVAITYTEALEPKFSSIEVTSASGARVDKADLHIVGDGKHVAVSLQPLPAGTYTVKWQATSVDTHKTEGSYTFTVGK